MAADEEVGNNGKGYRSCCFLSASLKTRSYTNLKYLPEATETAIATVVLVEIGLLA